MNMTPGLRKFALTAHIAASVGWLGAIAGFLALAVAGLTTDDPQSARGAYPAMELIASFVIVPAAVASFLTGVLQSLGTPWGLVRHYWVLAKLLLTVIATVFLFVHLQPIRELARVAREAPLPRSHLQEPRRQLVVDSATAVVVLLVITGLGVYKPRGMTRYGWRRRQGKRAEKVPTTPER